MLQKIILGQTEGHFSTCSSLAIGLNLDKSTCWTQRRGAKNMCNARISLDSNRKCLDQVLTNESLNSAQVDLFTLSIYTGKLIKVFNDLFFVTLFFLPTNLDCKMRLYCFFELIEKCLRF